MFVLVSHRKNERPKIWTCLESASGVHPVPKTLRAMKAVDAWRKRFRGAVFSLIRGRGRHDGLAIAHRIDQLAGTTENMSPLMSETGLETAPC